MHRTPALLAAAAALIGAGTAAAAPSPAEIAPGGNITAVVEATERDGWPHETTRNESRAVTDLAIWHAGILANPRERTRVVCYFGGTIARAYCGVVYTGRRGRTAFRMNVRVWEDGSYRFNRATPRPRTAGGEGKLPTVPFCNESSAGFCNPVDPAVVGHVPPDLPRAEKLRRELVKARAALAACRG